VTPDRLRAVLEAEVTAVGFAATPQELELFARYLDLIARWRAHARLTAVADPESAARLHIADSLLCLRAGIPQGSSLVDVGSGAGLPGIPLLIARGDLRVTLLEADTRKAAFLEIAAGELGLAARVVRARAEEAARGEMRERFDVAVARAVARLPTLCELTLPFVRVGGRAVLLKGPSVRAELGDGRPAARALGGSEPDLLEGVLKGGEHRTLVVIEKRRQMPGRFPRRGGALSRPIPKG